MDQVVEKKFNFNSIAAIVFIVLAVILLVAIPSQIDKPLIQLSFGQFNLPPELFPQIVAACMLVLGAWFLYKSFALSEINELKNLNKEAIVNVLTTLVMMAIYVPLMVNLGFVVGSAIMIFAMSTYFGNRNYIVAVLISIFLPMLIFVTFRRLLLVELPPFPIDIYPLTNWSLI
ncbi:MAG: tripartite tricarboxylate transporter TctB family protein [Rhodospirillaceae bacterium]|jgi:putative tricarboxylic transport membrane protein|nr:tripartite tricarboxylate transporter TctB family protein [Rhodospirillaceae bacterium]MBT4941091.1 tripartite tricarboxylate transporter TctB family protein [Rhodospirillaceae bacterium]MBT7956470.1 tripartite tricarboxylate transporter TctB family protein [Rhodospirillaceae bacterium]